MSNKPIKKTDANKAWNRKKSSSKYNLSSKETKKTFLIVTEGQTEELYFKAFPVISSFKVKVIDLKGQSKSKMIEITDELKKSASIKYDQIWCVFDMDVKQGADEFADFDNAIIQGRSKGYKIAYSNDCFELWFYLHFQYTEQKNHRTFYYQELSKIWNFNYEKLGKSFDFSKEVYQKLEHDENASQEKAITWAEKLLHEQSHLPFHQQNPVTTIHTLVEELNKNLRS